MRPKRNPIPDATDPNGAIATPQRRYPRHQSKAKAWKTWAIRPKIKIPHRAAKLRNQTIRKIRRTKICKRIPTKPTGTPKSLAPTGRNRHLPGVQSAASTPFRQFAFPKHGFRGPTSQVDGQGHAVPVVAAEVNHISFPAYPSQDGARFFR